MWHWFLLEVYTPREVRTDYHCKANFDNAILIREELGVLDFI